MTRLPAVSGLFYNRNKDELINDITQIFKDTKNYENLEKTINKRNIKTVLVPHAGYVYSGKTASYAFKEICDDGLPETFIVIGPNHTGAGVNLAVTPESKWKTPLGNVDIDREFIEKLKENNSLIKEDSLAEFNEHSVEVEIPFIQYIAKKQEKDIKIVPITMKNQDPITSTLLGESIYKTAHDLTRDIIIVASSDMTHYQPESIARTNDAKVLKNIENLDVDSMLTNIQNYNISMCGYGPVTAGISFSLLENAVIGKILNYATSGDASGDYSSVVGYASMLIK